MSKEGRIAAGSAVTLASSAVAIAVKAGAPKPDISSAALKKTLLNARSISYTDPLPAVPAAFISQSCWNTWG